MEPDLRGKTLTPVSPRPAYAVGPSTISTLEKQMDHTFDETSAHWNAETSPAQGLSSVIPSAGAMAEPSGESSSASSLYDPAAPQINGADHDPNGATHAPASVETSHGQAAGNEDEDIDDDYAMSLDLDDDDANAASDGAAQNAPIAETNPAVLPDSAATVGPGESAAVAAAVPGPGAASAALAPDVKPNPVDLASLPDLRSHANGTSVPAPPISSQPVAATAAALHEVNQTPAVSVGGDEKPIDAATDVANGGVDIQTLLDNLSSSIRPSRPKDGPTTALSTTAEIQALDPSRQSHSPSQNYAGQPPVAQGTASREAARGLDATASTTLPPGLLALLGQASNAASGQHPGSPLSGPDPTAGDARAPSQTEADIHRPAGNTSQPSTLQTDPSGGQPTGVISQASARNDLKAESTANPGKDDGNGQGPWTPELEKVYDEFVKDEKIYVGDGQWDRFPPASRMFIGNLPTERVSKRELFLIFHRHGKLAQISIKQAYGFIQFHDAASCQRALQHEQGQMVRGRKMHLEVSKPQNKPGPGPRGGANRRSRSPDYSRGGRSPRNGGGPPGRMANERADRGFDHRGGRDRGRRDDYRPQRSPSPRNYRAARDRARGRERDRMNRRSRSISPFERRSRYRSRSPVRAEDEDAALPLPRRAARDIPETQFIVLDDLDRNFIAFVEKTFRDRGISTDVLILNPRLSLGAVIRRQILEGVQAVSRLTRASQAQVKIPLQVFDRRGGVDNVRFEEYEDLDPHIAAELVVRAKQTHGAPPPPLANPYGGGAPAYQAPGYGGSQPTAAAHPTANMMGPASGLGGGPANIASLISTLDGPTLQKLLGALQQQSAGQSAPLPSNQAAAPGPHQSFPADLASLFGGGQAGGPRQMPPTPYAQPTQATYGGAPAAMPASSLPGPPPSNPYAGLGSAGMPPFSGNPALASLLASVGSAAAGPGAGAGGPGAGGMRPAVGLGPGPHGYAPSGPIGHGALQQAPQYPGGQPAAAQGPPAAGQAGAAGGAKPNQEVQNIMQQLARWKQ